MSQFAFGNPTVGTGGLLICYTRELKGGGNFSSVGCGSERNGGSGGGSVNVFYESKEDGCSVSVDAFGSWDSAYVGQWRGNVKCINSPRGTLYNGGAGSASIGSINAKIYIED